MSYGTNQVGSLARRGHIFTKMCVLVLNYLIGGSGGSGLVLVWCWRLVLVWFWSLVWFWMSDSGLVLEVLGVPDLVLLAPPALYLSRTGPRLPTWTVVCGLWVMVWGLRPGFLVWELPDLIRSEFPWWLERRYGCMEIVLYVDECFTWMGVCQAQLFSHERQVPPGNTHTTTPL